MSHFVFVDEGYIPESILRLFLVLNESQHMAVNYQPDLKMGWKEQFVH